LSVLGLIFLVHSIPFAGLLSVYKDDLNYHTLNAEHLQNKSKGDVIEQTITHCALPLSPLSLSRSLEARALSTFPTTPPPHQLPLFALSLPLHAAAAAAATLLLGAPAAAAVATPLPPTGPAPAPPTVEPGFVVVAVVVVAPFVADAVGVVAAAADVVVAAAGPPGMCGLLFISQLARCLCRSSSILVRCIPSPDSFKVSFIIAINQTEKKNECATATSGRVAAVETNVFQLGTSRDADFQRPTEQTCPTAAAPSSIVAAAAVTREPQRERKREREKSVREKQRRAQNARTVGSVYISGVAASATRIRTVASI